MKKLLENKLLVSLIAALMICVGCFCVAKGYEQYQDLKEQKITIQNWSGDYIEAEKQEPNEEQMLQGANPNFESQWMKHNGLQTFVLGGTMFDASTTLMSVINPFGTGSTTPFAITSTTDSTQSERYDMINYAENYNGKTAGTSTINLLQIEITEPATTSMSIRCGAATDAFSAPTYDLATFFVPTGTVGLLQNDIATGTGGLGVIGGGATSKIVLTHDYSYFTCRATGTVATGDWVTNGYINGLIGANDTFNAKYKVRIIRDMSPVQ